MDAYFFAREKQRKISIVMTVQEGKQLLGDDRSPLSEVSKRLLSRSIACDQMLFLNMPFGHLRCNRMKRRHFKIDRRANL